MLAEAYGSDRLQAVSAETDPAIPDPSGNPFLAKQPAMDFGAFTVTVGFQSQINPRGDGVCLCLAVSDHECWIVGNACDIRLNSGNKEQPNLDLLLLEEGRFEDSRWIPGRRLNGDESAQLSMDKPSVWHLKFFTYQ